MPETLSRHRAATRARPAAAVSPRHAARGRRCFRTCEGDRGRAKAPARWSMSAASISPSSPWCWNPRSRCAPRGARFYAGWPRWPMRSPATRHPTSRSRSTGRRCRRVDGGLVGGARLGLARRCARRTSRRPGWCSARMIRTVSMGEDEPGLRPLSSALDEEGFDESRFRPAGRELRAPSHGRDRRLAGKGLRRGGAGAICSGSRRRRKAASGASIDDNGDLLIRRAGQAGQSSGSA